MESMSESKILVVTGGSRGIGAATARLAAANGWWVCITYLNGSEAAEGVVRVISAEGGHAISVQADVSSETSVVDLFRQVDREFGKATALVNNAATLETQMRLDSMDAPRIERILGTNVLGPMLCA